MSQTELRISLLVMDTDASVSEFAASKSCHDGECVPKRAGKAWAEANSQDSNQGRSCLAT